MNELLKKYLAPALVAVVVAILFCLLRTTPAYKLWKGYTVLSVPAAEYDAIAGTVNSVLEQCGCENIISLEAQKSETVFFLLDEFDDYDKAKTAYFFDKDGKSVLYYIPDANKKQAQKAAVLLNQNHNISATLDSRQSFPLLVPLVAMILFCAFIFFSENKIVFALSGIFGIFFCFSTPLYPASAAVCLELCAFYLAQKVWRRRGGVAFVLTNTYFWIFVAGAVICAFASGFIPGLLFVLGVCASFCVLVIFFNLQLELEKRVRFLPVPIRDAKAVGAMNLKTVRLTLFCACGIFLLLNLFLSGANFSYGTNAKDLYFPAPKEYNEEHCSFPLLGDFFEKKWNENVVRYRSLNVGVAQKPKDGETVTITRFEKVGGKITSKQEVLCIYDEAFRKAALDSIEPTAIEFLWSKQDRDFSVEYTAGKSSGGTAPLFVLIFAMFLPLGAALYYTFIWRRRHAF